MNRISRIMLVPVALALFVACSSSTSKPAAAPDLERFVATIGAGSEGARPYRTPAEQWALADLVIEGTAEAVADGPYEVDETYFADTKSTSRQLFRVTIVEVAVTRIFKGTLPAGANNRVYVAFDTHSVTAADLNPYFPKGVRVAGFLTLFDPSGREALGAGRPPGQPLYGSWPFVFAGADKLLVPGSEPGSDWMLNELLPADFFADAPHAPCEPTESCAASELSTASS